MCTHRAAGDEVGVEAAYLHPGQDLAGHLGEEDLEARGGGGVRLDEGAHEHEARQPRHAGLQAGQQRDQPAHRVSHQEQREARVLEYIVFSKQTFDISSVGKQLVLYHNSIY